MGISGGKDKKKVTDAAHFFELLREAKQKAVLTRTSEIKAILVQALGDGCAEETLRELLKATELSWERADKELVSKLRPQIERMFYRHDSERSGVLSPEQATVFFGDVVKEANAMSEAVMVCVLDRTLSDAVRFLRSDISTAMQSLQVLCSHECDWSSQVSDLMQLAARAAQDHLWEMKEDYLEHREQRNKAAFDVLDAHGSGGLSLIDVVQGLLPGTAANHSFCTALGFTHPERGEALVPGVPPGRSHRTLIAEFWESQRDEIGRCNRRLEAALQGAGDADLDTTLRECNGALSCKSDLNARLRPLLNRVFQTFDRDCSAALDEDTSAKLFDDFVTQDALVSAVAEEVMCDSLVALVSDAVNRLTRGKAKVQDCGSSLEVHYASGGVHTYAKDGKGRGNLQPEDIEDPGEYRNAIQNMQKEYRAEKKSRHGAAFAVLDQSGDNMLSLEDVVEGFLPGTELNAKFIEALGFSPPKLPRTCPSFPGQASFPGSPTKSPALPAARIRSHGIPLRDLCLLGATSCVGGFGTTISSIAVSQDATTDAAATEAGADSFAATVRTEPAPEAP